MSCRCKWNDHHYWTMWYTNKSDWLLINCWTGCQFIQLKQTNSVFVKRESAHEEKKLATTQQHGKNIDNQLWMKVDIYTHWQSKRSNDCINTRTTKKNKRRRKEQWQSRWQWWASSIASTDRCIDPSVSPHEY